MAPGTRLAVEQLDPALPADRRMECYETVQRVQAALVRLPSRQRDAVMLQIYQLPP